MPEVQDIPETILNSISVVPDEKGCTVPHGNPVNNGHKRKVMHECPCDTIR